MRKALNENPLVQAAFIGVLALGVGLLLLMRMGGSSEPAPEPSATATQADPAATAAAPTDTAPTEAAPAPAQGDTAPPVEVGGGAGSDFKAGPGLPEGIVDAWNRGETVVLLVIREHPQGCFSSGPGGVDCAGIDDQEIAGIVRFLNLRPNTHAVVTHAHGAWRYSRITQGIDIDRAPALIVLRPKALTDGPLPGATVSYGFRGVESVLQAIKNAEYKGPDNLPYYPR